jgi:hypothetical protein
MIVSVVVGRESKAVAVGADGDCIVLAVLRTAYAAVSLAPIDRLLDSIL